MPFTFKLSQRLARMKLPLAVAAAAFAACEQPVRITDPTPPNSSVVQVVIVPDTVTLNPYQTRQFLAYGRTQAGDSVAVAVRWSASGGAITADGSYSADTIAGDYLVTATLQPHQPAPTAAASGTTQVSGSSGVKNRGLLAQVVETPSTTSVSVGRTAQFSAYGKTKNGDSIAVSVTWSSTNPVVAAVSSSGLMTGMAGGSATITATSQNKSGTATATVTNLPVASVTVSPTAASFAMGATTQLTATPKDSNGTALSGRAVTWATSNPAVAMVSASGLVTGAAAGATTITATSEGQSGTSAMTVTNVPVASVTVSPASGSVTVGATVQLAAVTKDAAGNVLTGRTGTWSSSNTSVATVSGTGLVTGLTAGTATITATSEGVAGTAAITVTTAVTNPGTVTDLAVVGVADTGVTLAFTEVTDGTGLPASYDVRYQVGTITWGSTATSVTRGTCATPLAGTAIGATRTCTVLGLTPATAYQFRLTEFRGTLNLNAVFGGLSNIAGATTAPSSTGTGGGPQPGPTAIIIIQDGFESGDLSQWGFQSDAGSGRYSLTTDPTRVKSGTHSLQVLFTPTNTYGMITRWFMPGYDEVYVKFNVMFEENFDESYGLHFLTIAGNNINDQYSSWGKPAIVPNGTDYFYAGVDPEFVNGDAPLKPFHFYTYWPDMSCCYGNRFYQTAPKIPLVSGQWQEVVFHIKLNTPGQSDGSQALWINGVKKIDVQNMRWRTTTDLRLNEIRFDDYMSQGPKTEHLWVDDVTVWRP